MASRKYYVICEDNCKFESMTKEQILAAITQAVESGEVGDVDTGFVSKVKTVNGSYVNFFIGTQAEYDALDDSVKNDNLVAFVTNDTTKSDYDEAVKKVEEIIKGTQAVGVATYASEDKSKGTIEERLTNLGFKQGVVQGDDVDTAHNAVYRQGNFVIAPDLRFHDINASSGAITIVGTLPEGFRPKIAYETAFVGIVSMNVYTYVPVTIDTSGFIYIRGAVGKLVDLFMMLGFEALPIE